METRQSTAYYALLGLSLVFSILALLTLVPNPGAIKPNVLGYRSVCSFAPAASALCGLLAGITCSVRRRFVSTTASQTRYRPPFALVAAAVPLIAIALVFGIRFLGAQSRFGSLISKTAVQGGQLAGTSDGTRSATITEGEITAAVELTVAGGRIDSIRMVSARNVEQSVAEKIFDAVKAAQSSDVDVVSGATASSNVLLKAIEAAALQR